MLAKVRRYAKSRYKMIMAKIISEYQAKTGATDIKVLDVGAGSCWLLHSLPSNCVKVGVDISPHHQCDDDTFSKFLVEGSNHFISADATQMPFPDNTFDIVFSNEFMSHVNDIDKAAAEQIRILKKRGVMIIMDANFLDPLNFIMNFLVDYIRSRGKLGGFRWLFHRDEPFYIKVPEKQGFREVCYNSENTHCQHWWAKKLGAYSSEIEFGVSVFCSFLPLRLPQFLSNKVLAVGQKL